jgi:hypothetical protein
MLLYVIYNAPLVCIADGSNPRERIVGFVDDTTLLARGRDFAATHSTIKDMMERQNGVFSWSNTFNSPLEMNKLALVNFSHSQPKTLKATNLILEQRIQGHTRTHNIRASPNAKLLGVLLDSRLSWSAQHDKVREKAVKWTAIFKRFTRPSTGICANKARRLYIAVAVPKICYAADLWFSPSRNCKANDQYTGPTKITKRLESIQRQAAISITGAMRTSPADATIAHANLTPIGIQLKQMGAKAYLCLAS